MKKKKRNIPQEKKKSTILRLLIIEDDPHDAERMVGVLEKGGYRCRWDRVEARADFISRLDTGEYDLTLADYNKQIFDGISAIQICLEHNQNLPLIIVSGDPGEEKAIECLKNGATDYVLKDHLPRLIPVVERALQEKEEHRRRKVAEKTLRENEKKYRSLYQEFQGILDAIPDSLVLIAPDLKVVWANEGLAVLLNKKNSDLIGQYCYQIWHSRSEPCKVCPVQRSFRSKKSESEEVLTPDGRIWDVRGVPLIGDRGEVKGVIEVARNITEKKRADEALRLSEEELKKSSEKIKLFSYSVSHDLKNPAIVLYGLTNHLKKHYGGILNDEGRHFCDQISKTSEQIFDLVEKINLFISTKESPLTIETVKLKEIIQMLKEEFSPQLNIRQIVWEEPKDPPEIRADRISLLRALRNLVDNSLKYGGDELSEITIGYEGSPDFHTLFVQDNGVGLKKEASKNIFGWFTRFETSKGIEGSGLGLSIVKEIAERHRGTVWMEPVPSKGITFYLSIFKAL